MKPENLENWTRKTTEVPNAYFEEMQISVLSKIEKRGKETQRNKNRFWMVAASIILLISGLFVVNNLAKPSLSVKNAQLTYEKPIIKQKNTPNHQNITINSVNDPQKIQIKKEPQISKKTIVKNINTHLNNAKNKEQVLYTNVVDEDNVDDLLDKIINKYSTEEIAAVSSVYDENVFSLTE